MLKKTTQYLIIFCLCVIYPCFNLFGADTLNKIYKQHYPFCNFIFYDRPPLDFRIAPFHMHSFFEPKFFLRIYPSQKLELVSAMDGMNRNNNCGSKSNLSSYGVGYCTIYRRGIDYICIMYSYGMEQKMQRCLPIPALKRPILTRDQRGNIVANFDIGKAYSSDLDGNVVQDYKKEKKTMSLTDLRRVLGSSVDVIYPKIKMTAYEFQTNTQCLQKNSRNQCIKEIKSFVTKTSRNSKIECLKGLDYAEKGYYIKKYDNIIKGHRYFWIRKNKNKLVRHTGSNGVYYGCDDSKSYDLDSVLLSNDFVTSIEPKSDHYVIPRNMNNVMLYKNSTMPSCDDSQLYLYVPFYASKINDDNECLFGSLFYLDKYGKKYVRSSNFSSVPRYDRTKVCSYEYISDDFQVFGIYKNRTELKSLNSFLDRNGILSGLVERNLYLERMCLDYFPKYEYKIKKHIDGTKTQRYVFNMVDYPKCDFIKVEAWGGGQAGYIKNGESYSGAPGHYTLGILKTSIRYVESSQSYSRAAGHYVSGRLRTKKLTGKKLVIHVGEGGQYPEEYGEDTVVALCDTNNFNDKCEIVLVARGCTHSTCHANNSFIKDDLIVHYRSATGMDFSVAQSILRNNRLIPWGNPDFPDGIVELNADDCSGPTNAFEKNPNQYPGSGGCANKSIQQGADGLVRLTCEMWNDNVQDKKYIMYTYNQGRGYLCNGNSCISKMCIYSSGGRDMEFANPILMFGHNSAKCLPFKKTNDGTNQDLLKKIVAAGNTMIIKPGQNGQYCYDNGDRTNNSQCRLGSDLMVLSCYRGREAELKISSDQYVCCYHTLKEGNSHVNDICWKDSGINILKKFDYESLPLRMRKNFDDGAKELLTSLEKTQPNTGLRALQYVYDAEKAKFCFDTTDHVKNKGCLAGVCVYSADSMLKSDYKLPKQRDGICKDFVSGATIDSKEIEVSCTNEHCCYSNSKTGNSKNSICLSDDNVVLSCRNNASNNLRTASVSKDGESANYTCCYSDLANSQKVCWKPNKDIWQILGYYSLPESVKNEIQKQYKKATVVVKDSRKRHQQRSRR